jgi:polynucleotide 5'-hydroxyl-kinase GRC3/NOL9
MIVPKRWEEEFQKLSDERGIVILVFGGPDTGKTTFVRYLLRKFCENHRRVGFVDADVGQSSLGPPTTVGMAIYEDADKMSDDAHPVQFQFVGSTTPLGHLLPDLIGLKRLVDKAFLLGAELVVVDTTGLIRGPAAQELKQRKIDLLLPKYLFALQKSGELEPLLSPYKFSHKLLVSRLPVTPEAKPKSPEYRRSYREGKFRKYFSQVTKLEIGLKEVGVFGTWLGNGRRLSEREIGYLSKILATEALYGEADFDCIHLITAGPHATRELFRVRNHFGVENLKISEITSFQGRLLALNQEEDPLGLGILEKIDFQKMQASVLTPLRSLEKVRRIYFGALRLDSSGKELGKI